MFIYHARQRSKFSISYHMQSRHSPRTKQIDLGFQWFSQLILWFPGCPSMDLKDQQVTTWIRHRRLKIDIEKNSLLFGRSRFLPNHHYLQANTAFRLRKVLSVSCGIDMGEICQLALGHLHPQVRQIFRKGSDCRLARSADVIDSTDGLIELPIWSRYGLLEMPCLGQGWIGRKPSGVVKLRSTFLWERWLVISSFLTLQDYSTGIQWLVSEAALQSSISMQGALKAASSVGTAGKSTSKLHPFAAEWTNGVWINLWFSQRDHGFPWRN